MAAVGKIETVLINVNEIEKAVEFYGKLFGIEFEPVTESVFPGGLTFKAAWSPSFGLELIQQTNPPSSKEGARGFAVRVPDIEEMKEEMGKRGMKPSHEWTASRGNEHAAVYDLGGFRFIISQHEDF